jgi:hypothetical protein
VKVLFVQGHKVCLGARMGEAIEKVIHVQRVDESLIADKFLADYSFINADTLAASFSACYVGGWIRACVCCTIDK